MSKYNVPYVVLNACESASTGAGAEANLARVFVQHGIPFVLGMSYKMLTSAINVFATSFYKALLVDGKSFPIAAAMARTSMRWYKSRTARLGLPITLEDWIVPVTYVSLDMVDPRRVCHHRYIHRHRDPTMIDLCNRWDTELLNLETKLLDPWDCGAGPVVNLYGFSGIGKTTLLEHCLRWWTKTGMVQKAVYFSLRQSGYVEPTSILPQLARALNSREPNPIHIVSSIEPNPFPHLNGSLDAIFDWLTAYEADRRFLLVIDDFPTFHSLPDSSPLTREEKIAWKDFLYGEFARFQKQALVVISSTSKLQWLSLDSRSEAIEDDTVIEDPHLNGDDSPTSPFYAITGFMTFLSETKGSDSPFWMSLNDPEQLQLLRDIAEYFGYLPALVEHFVAQPIRNTTTPSDETYEDLKSMYECFLRSRGPPVSLEHEDRFLETLPVTHVCAEYFNRQGPVEKAILLSLSKFVGYLGDDLASYWHDYIQCLTKDTSRCLPREYHSHHLPHWIPHKHKPKYWLLALGKENVEEEVLLQKGVKILRELRRLGLLKQTFFFLKLNGGRHSAKEPAYQIHPCLSIFLQQRAQREIPRPDNYSSSDTWTFQARTKASFLTYLRRRMETWDGASSPFTIETDSPEFFQGLNSNVEEGMLRKSVLAGLHMWLEMDSDHQDISYPKAVFDHYLAPWPAMTRDIEPSTIADLVEEVRPFLESHFMSEYSDARELQQHAFSRSEAKRRSRLSQSMEDTKVTEELKKAHEELVTSLIALREGLQAGTWLVWYNVLRGRPRAALQHIERNQALLAQLPHPKFNEIAGFVPGLPQEIRHAELVAGFLTQPSDVSLSQLDRSEKSWESLLEKAFDWALRIDDPVAMKFNAIGPRLLREGLRISRAGMTWGLRTKEERDALHTCSTKLLREAFEELVSIPFGWYKNRSSMLPRLLSEMASHFGMNIGDSSLTAEAVLEFISAIPKDIARPLKKIYRLFEAARADVTNGQSPARVFEIYHEQLVTLITTAWRNAILFFLDYTASTNRLIEAMAYHQFIIADYFYRQDWEALDIHLTRLTSHTERGGEPQWQFCRGVCALRLRRWEEAGACLEKAFQATHNLTQYQLSNFALFGAMGVFAVRCFILRHLIAYKYAVPAERDTCSLPTWSLYLQLWILGYATHRKMNYAQSGGLLELFTEHYFALSLEPRPPERVLDQPTEHEYGHAMKWYDTREGRSIKELSLPRQQLEAHILIEFIRHALKKGFLFDDDVEQTVLAAETFFRSFQLERTFMATHDEHSVKMFRQLSDRVLEMKEDRKIIFEEVERNLFKGRDADIVEASSSKKL